MSKAEEAVSRFPQEYNCSQAVFSTYAAELGLEPDQALRIAAPFGGGIGRAGEVCGAVTGAIMVLGLKVGSTEAGDSQGREKAYDLAHKFLQQFKAQHGSVLCRELLGYTLSIPEERQAARDKKLFTSLCPQFVRTVANILEQMF